MQKKRFRTYSPIHFRIRSTGRDQYRCGVGRQDPTQAISSTRHFRNVTCGNCRKLLDLPVPAKAAPKEIQIGVESKPQTAINGQRRIKVIV